MFNFSQHITPGGSVLCGLLSTINDPVGVLVQFLHPYFSEPIKRIANFIEIFQKAASGFNRFTEILILADIVDSPRCRWISGKIEFKNVSFTYNDSDHAKDNNLTISLEKPSPLLDHLVQAKPPSVV